MESVAEVSCQMAIESGEFVEVESDSEDEDGDRLVCIQVPSTHFP